MVRETSSAGELDRFTQRPNILSVNEKSALEYQGENSHST